MFYFNQKAARLRGIARVTLRTEVAIKVDGYKLAVADGKAAAAEAMPKLQAIYTATLAREQVTGRTQIDCALSALDARLAALA